MNTWNKLGLMAGVVAIAGGVVFADIAAAQTPTPEPTESASEESATADKANSPAERQGGWFFGRFGGRDMERDGWFFGRMGGPKGNHGGPGRGRFGAQRMGPLHEERLAIAAEALGRDEEALRTALTEALDAYLDQAVEDGDLTQAQADALRERADDGFFFGAPGRGPRAALLDIFQGERQAIMAETLGLTVAELEAARDDGQTPAEIAEEQGLDEDEVRANFQQAVETRLEAAVEAGEITQTQADALLERIDEADPFFSERGGRPFRGGWRR